MSLDQRNYEEKRDFIRVPVKCVVDLQHAGNGSVIRAIRNE